MSKNEQAFELILVKGNASWEQINLLKGMKHEVKRNMPEYGNMLKLKILIHFCH